MASGVHRKRGSVFVKKREKRERENEKKQGREIIFSIRRPAKGLPKWLRRQPWRRRLRSSNLPRCHPDCWLPVRSRARAETTAFGVGGGPKRIGDGDDAETERERGGKTHPLQTRPKKTQAAPPSPSASPPSRATPQQGPPSAQTALLYSRAGTFLASAFWTRRPSPPSRSPLAPSSAPASCGGREGRWPRCRSPSSRARGCAWPRCWRRAPGRSTPLPAEEKERGGGTEEERTALTRRRGWRRSRSRRR